MMISMKARLQAGAVLLLTVAVGAAAFLVTLVAFGAPASQPASAPAAVPIDNLAALAQTIISAINLRNWPALVVSLLVVALFVERHFKGLTGNRFSTWLGTKLGLFLSSLFAALVTAAAGVATQGWKAIGNACVAAAVVAGINFVAQFAGPATRAPADPPVAAKPADPPVAAKPADPPADSSVATDAGK